MSTKGDGMGSNEADRGVVLDALTAICRDPRELLLRLEAVAYAAELFDSVDVMVRELVNSGAVDVTVRAAVAVEASAAPRPGDLAALSESLWRLTRRRVPPKDLSGLVAKEWAYLLAVCDSVSAAGIRRDLAQASALLEPIARLIHHRSSQLEGAIGRQQLAGEVAGRG